MSTTTLFTGPSPSPPDAAIEGSSSLAGEAASTCVDPNPPADDTVLVFFHCDAPGAEPGRHRVGVRRASDGGAVLRNAVLALTTGPTLAERQVGFYSAFSEASSSLIADVSLSGGAATVDFTEDLRRMVGVGTTAGSGLLVGELTDTVFQFDSVESVTFTLEGSAAAWCSFVVGDSECGAFERTV